jgi:hypothetical protein
VILENAIVFLLVLVIVFDSGVVRDGRPHVAGPKVAQASLPVQLAVAVAREFTQSIVTFLDSYMRWFVSGSNVAQAETPTLPFLSLRNRKLPTSSFCLLTSYFSLGSRGKFGQEISDERSVDGRLTKGHVALSLAAGWNEDEFSVSDAWLGTIHDPEFWRV